MEYLNKTGIPIYKSIPEYIHSEKERSKMPSSYFLEPSTRKFPYKTKEGKISKQLLRAAMTRAGQYGHTAIYKRAKKLYKKNFKNGD